MRCIFCKNSTVGSKSVEHIIPESLGNTNHILTFGLVCGACNNYFSIKIEKPILDSGMFRFLRMNKRIANKVGRSPSFLANEFPNLPDYRLMSRFLGKIGLEVMANRIAHTQECLNQLIDHPDLDDLRKYVRFNVGKLDWPFTCRAIYPVDTIFQEAEIHFEVLHEYDLLNTVGNEFYIIVAIFGVEFAFNLGGPYLDGYHAWLEQNQYRSPLYISRCA